MAEAIVVTEEMRKAIAERRAKALQLKADLAAKRAAGEQSSTKPINNLTREKKIMLNQPVKINLTGKCELISKDRFTVEIGYHEKMVQLFKTIPSKAYDASTKRWNFHIGDHNLLMKEMKLFKELNLSYIPKYAVDIIADSKPLDFSQIDLSPLASNLMEALYPFQLDGVRFVISKNGRALIADDMGLGKTIQAIAAASFYRSDWPLLVIAPSSMRYSWEEAIKKWLPDLKDEEVAVVDNSKSQFGKVAVLIISYDLVTKKVDYLKMRNFGVVIVDESHFIKNYKSSRTQAVLPLLRIAKRAILLSGTPALSRPCELYTQISAIHSNLFPSFNEFGIRYCAGKKMSWGWNFTGASNMTELHVLLEKTVLLRRLKSEVITELPAKLREMVVLDPTKIVHHKEIKSAHNKWNEQHLKGAAKRGALLDYFHETGLTKMAAVSEYVIDQVESEKKFLCFAHHESVLNCICEKLDSKKVDYIRIDGKTPSLERKILCDKFQYNDSCRVAVLSITAANMGLTLTAAQFVMFGELFWNPGILTQAEDRVHRIGQKNSVVVQYLVAKQTADDYLWPIVQNKLEVLSKAGLSKDDFKNVDLVTLKDSKQTSLDDLDWLEEFSDPFTSDDELSPVIKKAKMELPNH